MDDPVGEVVAPEAPAAPAEAPAEAPSFKDTLPEDLRDDPTIGRFKSTEDLARAYREAKTKIGWDPTQVVKLPGENATEHDFAPIYKALGRPDDTSGYEVPTVEGFKFNGDFVDAMTKAAHEVGMGKKQFENLMKNTGEFHKTQMTLRKQQTEQQKESAERELKNTWGADYETKKAQVDRAMAALGEGNERFVKTMEIMAKYGATLEEDTALHGATAGGDAAIGSPAAALRELEKLKTAPDFLEKRRNDPDFDTRVQGLYAAAFPEKKKNG